MYRTYKCYDLYICHDSKSVKQRLTVVLEYPLDSANKHSFVVPELLYRLQRATIGLNQNSNCCETEHGQPWQGSLKSHHLWASSGEKTLWTASCPRPGHAHPTSTSNQSWTRAASSEPSTGSRFRVHTRFCVLVTFRRLLTVSPKFAHCNLHSLPAGSSRWTYPWCLPRGAGTLSHPPGHLQPARQT